MINGVRVRDSGVELSPTGTDRRGGPRTASNRTVRASSAIAAGSTRWLMRRTKRPLSATPEDRATHGHPWPPMATLSNAKALLDLAQGHNAAVRRQQTTVEFRDDGLAGDR